MGIIKIGILGGFRQKTGTVVGASWRGLDVIRAVPKTNGKIRTQAQKDQQIKFALITGFLGNISDLIDMGYKALSKVATPMNIAVSHNLHTAITGVSPNFTLDFTKLKISEGPLNLPLQVDLVSLPDAKIKITWDHAEPDDKLLSATDLMTVLAYNPGINRFVKRVAAAPRSAGQFTLQLPVSFANNEVHCYVVFNSKIKKHLVSDSRYAAVTVLA